ncbi:MAG: glycerate kinase [Chloroflexi bacterium]|nr:glycerate kinase [Chloroflexota bacterium]
MNNLAALRSSALAIFHAALATADARAAVHRAMQRDGNRLIVDGRAYDLARMRRVFVIGFGKASAAMAQAAEAILGDKLVDGAVSVKYEHTAPLKKIELTEAGHPLPDANSLLGAEKILALLRTTTPDDLVICVISGGGSALLESLVAGVTLDDLRATTDALLRAGATINELNTLRKHISQVKGGQLARHSNAPIIALILSDVLGSPLDTIASGPTAPDTTTFADARAVIEQRGVRDQLPACVVAHIERGARGEIADTPKAGDAVFARAQNVIIADNAIACDAAIQAARERGFNALLLSTFMQGEAREVAKVLAAIAKEIAQSSRPLARPACLIAGGETTVTVRGNGKGGRNQELVLAAAIDIAGMPDVCVLCGGTDGTDGPTDAAGALADGETIARAQAHGLDARDFLARNDAYHFFKPLDDLLITGPTNTNLNDVIIVLMR